MNDDSKSTPVKQPTDKGQVRMFGKRHFTLDSLVRIFFSILIAVGVIWLLYFLRDILLPFAVACLIAFMIEPLVRLNMKLTRISSRIIPVLLTLIEIIAVTGGIAFIFMPEIIRDSHEVSLLIDHYTSLDPADLPFLPEWAHRFLHGHMSLPSISEWLKGQQTEKILANIINFFSGGLNVLGGVIGWAIVILYLFFILLNYPSLMNGIKSIVPPRYRHISDSIIYDTGNTLKRYFRTQALISLIVGIIYAIGFSIAGLPLGAAIGLMNAILFMVPYLVYVSLIPVTILAMVCAIETGVDFWSLWLKCIAVYMIVECIADLWLTPKIMGKSLNLDPAVMLLSLSVWGKLLGFLGVILALPLTVVVICYYRKYILHDDSVEMPH